MRRIRLNNKKTIIVLSMAISILLWSYVMGDINPSTAKQLLGIGVSVGELEDDSLVVTSELEPSVDVRISGRRNDIYEIRRSDMSFSVDLSGYGEGTHSVPINMETTVRAANANIDYSPKVIDVTIEKVISESFDVELQTTGEFSPGVDEDMLQLQTKKVTVSGIRSRVDQISKVVARLNVSGVKNDQDVSTDLIPVDSDGKEVTGVELDREAAIVGVLGADIKRASVVPVIVGELPEGYELGDVSSDPSEVKFIDKGGAESLSEIKTEEIDISELKESKELKVKLVVPENIEVVGSTEVTVSLTVSEGETIEEEVEISEKTIEYEFSEVSLLNISEDAEIDNKDELPETIQLTIRGESKDLETISKDDINLTIDFSGVSSSGEYSLSVEHDGVPEGVEVLATSPESIVFAVTVEAD